MAKRFTISLLGIDGSGKTTTSKELKLWLESNGNKVKIIPFHHWVFAENLKKKAWKTIDKGRPSIQRPYEPKKNSLAAIIKPIVALVDNIIFYIMKFPDGKEADVVIFDRFICATQIKLGALNYHTKWLKPIWWNIKTDIAFIFDVSEDLSIKRQIQRNDSYVYTKEQLRCERKEYLDYAQKNGLLVIDNNVNSKDESIEKIIEYIGRSI